MLPPTPHVASHPLADRVIQDAVPRRWGGLSLRLSERKILLYGVDVLAVTIALLGTLALRTRLPFGWHSILIRPMWFELLILLWTICAPLLNAYDLRTAAKIPTGVAGGSIVAVVVAGIYLFIPYITPPLLQSRLTAFTFLGLMVGLIAAERAAYAGLLVQPTFRHRVLIVGAGWAGRSLIEAVRTHARTEYDPVGFVDDDPTRQGDVVDGLPVLGTSLDLVGLVRERDASEIILGITRYESLAAPLVQALIDCHERGLQITMMQAVYERLTGKVPVEHAGNNLHLVLPTDRDPNRAYLLLKRTLDLVIGALGSLMTLILLPGIALAIRLEDSGPVFYRQTRVGRGGRPFELFKFRTMVQHAERNGPQWTQEADKRITRVGRVLRRLHVDELPQAINLLRGEMAFVGPRPERPEFVAELEAVIPFYRARHAVPPGITGWAQVNYRYGSSVEDALIKLQYDLYYNKHCSLFLDALILVRTLGLVLTLRGR
jgi:exopolysaccharide biosynthesis polyprenyl glycosylphosphotransferase